METLLVSVVCIESRNMCRVRNHAASEELVPWSKTVAAAGEAGALGGRGQGPSRVTHSERDKFGLICVY